MLQVGHDVYFKQNQNDTIALWGKIFDIRHDEIVFMTPTDFIFVPRAIAEKLTYTVAEFAMMMWENAV